MKLVEIMINFVYRMVFGIICIYFLNWIFNTVEIATQVGFNICTLFITGLLGMPGIVLLFVVSFIGGL